MTRDRYNNHATPSAEAMAARIRAYDARVARAAARERIARLACCCTLVAIEFALFYSIGSY